MQISSSGALIRWLASETVPPPFDSVPAIDFIKETDPRDGQMYKYFCGNPMDNEPPLYAGFGPQPVPVPSPVAIHPAGFDDIFGSMRPVDLADQAEWDNQLGRFRDNKRPDWCSDVMEAAAALMCLHYGLGRLAPYRLTNGAEIVAFPDADKRVADTSRGNLPKMYTAPASVVYQVTMFVVSNYQLALNALGIPIADPLSILRFLLAGQAGNPAHQA